MRTVPEGGELLGKHYTRSLASEEQYDFTPHCCLDDYKIGTAKI